MKVCVEIEYCVDCPHCRTPIDFTNDDYYCDLVKKSFSPYLDYLPNKFPTWCPLLEENKDD